MTPSRCRLIAALALTVTALGLWLTLGNPRARVEPTIPRAASVQVAGAAWQRDFDGYYVPSAAFPIGGFRFDALALRPEAFVVLASLRDGIEHPSATCKAAMVTLDSVDVACDYPGLGTVAVNGVFLVRELEPRYETDVLAAMVTVRTAGKIVYQARHRFHTSSGE